MIRIVAFASALAFAAPRPVFTDGVSLLGAPSPDGKWVSVVQGGALHVREIATGRSIPLAPAKQKEFAYFSIFSRDSKRIAYAWFNAEKFYELRVIGMDGEEMATVFKNPEAGFVQPCAWTPDGSHVLTLLFRKDNVSQIALVPVDGSTPRILRSLNWVYPKRMDLSPNGKQVVYDSLVPGSSSVRSLYLLDVDGASERRLTDTPGNHLFPLFAPDGGSIYFLSDGALAQMELREGAPIRLVEKGLGRALPLGITRNGVLYYGVRTGASDVFVAGLHNAISSAKPVSSRFPGLNMAPSFSPDGKRLAYLSRRGTENFGMESRVVVICDLDGGGRESEVTVRMAHLERVRWRADGKALLLSGSDGRGRGGVFEHDLQSGRTRPIAAEIGGPLRGFDAVSTSDGLYYVDGQSVKKAGGGIVYEGRNVKGLAALSNGALAVYDENAIVYPATRRQVVLDGVTEMVAAGMKLFVVRRGRLEIVGEQASYLLPENIALGVTVDPSGKKVAFSAGREGQEIWAIDVKK